jgi:hypothetical protein
MQCDLLGLKCHVVRNLLGPEISIRHHAHSSIHFLGETPHPGSSHAKRFRRVSPTVSLPNPRNYPTSLSVRHEDLPLGRCCSYHRQCILPYTHQRVWCRRRQRSCATTSEQHDQKPYNKAHDGSPSDGPFDDDSYDDAFSVSHGDVLSSIFDWLHWFMVEANAWHGVPDPAQRYARPLAQGANV